MSGPVVVGVDGSASSLAAVEVAAREARLRGAALRVVHAFLWPALHVPLGPSPLGPPDGGLRNLADRVVAEAVARARTAEPDVEIGQVVVSGEPLTVLEAQSRAAELVVVGSRGMGGFVGLLVGSTAVHLAAHGACPVLVVREEPRPDGPVVLGVDGSAAGRKAVDFAFAEASLRGAPLVALHAWTTWNAPMPPLPIRRRRTRTRPGRGPGRRNGCRRRRWRAGGSIYRVWRWSTGWCTGDAGGADRGERFGAAAGGRRAGGGAGSRGCCWAR
ncbi:hypothetical protein GCM10020256_02110 [Streptomyces thermocoprophilus]